MAFFHLRAWPLVSPTPIHGLHSVTHNLVHVPLVPHDSLGCHTLIRIRVCWHCGVIRPLCSTASNRASHDQILKVTLMQERVTIHVMGRITFHTYM